MRLALLSRNSCHPNYAPQEDNELVLSPGSLRPAPNQTAAHSRRPSPPHLLGTSSGVAVPCREVVWGSFDSGTLSRREGETHSSWLATLGADRRGTAGGPVGGKPPAPQFSLGWNHVPGLAKEGGEGGIGRWKQPWVQRRGASAFGEQRAFLPADLGLIRFA